MITVKRIINIFAAVTLVIYLCASFYILFMRLGGVDRLTQAGIAFNLIPFKTIIQYAKGVADGRGHALLNLAGNLLLFLPLGFYLPFFINKMVNARSYIIFAAVLIFTVELIQLLTGVGSFDIDDFILNLSGAVFGFLIFKHIPLIPKQRKNR